MNGLRLVPLAACAIVLLACDTPADDEALDVQPGAVDSSDTALLPDMSAPDVPAADSDPDVNDAGMLDASDDVQAGPTDVSSGDGDVPNPSEPGGQLFSIACNVGYCTVDEGSFDEAALGADGTLYAAGVRLRFAPLSELGQPMRYQLGTTAFDATGVELFESWGYISMSLGDNGRVVDVTTDVERFFVLWRVDDPFFSTSELTVTLHDSLSGTFPGDELPTGDQLVLGGGVNGYMALLKGGRVAGLAEKEDGSGAVFVVTPDGAEPAGLSLAFQDDGVTAVASAVDELVTVKNGQFVTYDPAYGVEGFEPFGDSAPGQLVAAPNGDWMVVDNSVSEADLRVARYDTLLGQLFESTLSHPAGRLTGSYVFDLSGETLVVGRLACANSVLAGAIWLTLLDSVGAVVWERFVDGYDTSEPQAVRILPSGELVVADLIFSAVSRADWAWRRTISADALATGLFGSKVPTCVQVPIETGCWRRSRFADNALTLSHDKERIYTSHVLGGPKADRVGWDTASGMKLDLTDLPTGSWRLAASDEEVFAVAATSSKLLVQGRDATGAVVLDADLSVELLNGKAFAASGATHIWITATLAPTPDGTTPIGLWRAEDTLDEMGTIGEGSHVAWDVALDPLIGGPMIAAETPNALDYSDVVVLRADASGAPLIPFVHPTTTHDTPLALASTPAGGAVVIGQRRVAPGANTWKDLLLHFSAEGSVLLEDTSADMSLVDVATDGVSAWLAHGSKGASRLDLATGATLTTLEPPVGAVEVLGPDRLIIMQDGVLEVRNLDMSECL